MKIPLYREALSHSWQITWKNKNLWIFGLFATLLGQMGLMELFTKLGYASSDYALYPRWLALPKLFKILDWGSVSLHFDGWIWLIWLGVIMFGFCIFGIFVAISSQGALIDMSGKFAKNKKNADLSVAWSKGVNHFWRLFGLHFLKKVILVVLAVIVGYATLNFVIQASGLGLVLFLLIFLLAVLVGMVVSFLVIYTAFYIVVEDYKLGKALHSAWNLFLDHWLVSLELAFIVLFINFVVGIVVLFLFLFLFLPMLFVWFVAVATSMYWLALVGLFLGMLFFLLSIILVGSIFTVFTTSIWVYVFTHMHKTGVVSHLLHWSGFNKK